MSPLPLVNDSKGTGNSQTEVTAPSAHTGVSQQCENQTVMVKNLCCIIHAWDPNSTYKRSWFQTEQLPPTICPEVSRANPNTGSGTPSLVCPNKDNAVLKMTSRDAPGKQFYLLAILYLYTPLHFTSCTLFVPQNESDRMKKGKGGWGGNR